MNVVWDNFKASVVINKENVKKEIFVIPGVELISPLMYDNFFKKEDKKGRSKKSTVSKGTNIILKEIKIEKNIQSLKWKNGKENKINDSKIQYLFGSKNYLFSREIEFPKDVSESDYNFVLGKVSKEIEKLQEKKEKINVRIKSIEPLLNEESSKEIQSKEIQSIDLKFQEILLELQKNLLKADGKEGLNNFILNNLTKKKIEKFSKQKKFNDYLESSKKINEDSVKNLLAFIETPYVVNEEKKILFSTQKKNEFSIFVAFPLQQIMDFFNKKSEKQNFRGWCILKEDSFIFNYNHEIDLRNVKFNRTDKLEIELKSEMGEIKNSIGLLVKKIDTFSEKK